MHKTEKTAYGYKITLGDFIKADEMQAWVDEAKAALIGAPGEFSCVIDMRDLAALPAESRELMQTGQKLFLDKGMKRSAVIVDSAVTVLQFKKIAKQSGIDAGERYIAGDSDDADSKAVAWAKDSVEP